MSRIGIRRLPPGGAADDRGKPHADDSAEIAEEIGFAALELAKRANAAGLMTIGYLLESAALEAGAEAAERQSPIDASKK
jgi:hypothetical protein